MGLLSGTEVSDGRSNVLPSGQRGAQQPVEAAAFSRGRIDVQRIGVSDGVRHVIGHLLADGKPVTFGRGFLTNQSFNLGSNQVIGHLELSKLGTLQAGLANRGLVYPEGDTAPVGAGGLQLDPVSGTAGVLCSQTRAGDEIYYDRPRTTGSGGQT